MCLPLALERPEDILEQNTFSGYDYVVMSNARGYRCGYVKVPAGHPLHGKDFDEVSLECHGGLTFGEPDRPCAAEGPDSGYWFGFDCAHGYDLVDLTLVRNDRARKVFEGIYGAEIDGASPFPRSVKSTEFVRDQCRSLIEQICALDAKAAAGSPAA